MIRPSKVAVFKRSCHSQCITVSSYSIPYSVFLNWRDAPSHLSLFQRLNVTQTLSSQPRPLGPSPSHQLFTTRSRSFKHSLPLLHSETSPNHNSRMKILHESDLPCPLQTNSHGKGGGWSQARHSKYQQGLQTQIWKGGEIPIRSALCPGERQRVKSTQNPTILHRQLKDSARSLTYQIHTTAR